MVAPQHNMTIEQVLNESLKMEKQAYDFYSKRAAGCSVDCVRELLTRLRDEESKHITMIQKLLVRFESGKDVLS